MIKQFTLECYQASIMFLVDENFTMVLQLKGVALSVHLNFTEGCSKCSMAERRRFFEISRSSLIEVDVILEIANEMGYLPAQNTAQLGDLMVSSFKMLSVMIKSSG